MKKYIAIIAHDGKKADMVAFLKDHYNNLRNTPLIATGNTEKCVKKANLNVKATLSGPLGGDAQIAALLTEGKVLAVFFFRDPLANHPHEADVQMLMRLCDVYDIPLATNPATGRHLLMGLKKFLN